MAFFTRIVPLALKIKVIFGGVAALLGWIFMAFGMIFVLVFGAMIDFEEYYYLTGTLPKTAGTVIDVSETNMEVNDRDVYAIRFSYQNPQGKTLEGTSYTTSRSLPNPGVKVIIEYAPQRPEVARIEGTSRGGMPIWVLFVVIFPVIGACFAVYQLFAGLRAVRLLQSGQMAYGKLIRQEPTNTRINNRTVYKFTFEFKADNGQTYQATASTHETHLLQDDAEERLFYDPYRPEQATLVDSLPGRPQVDSDGNIAPVSFLSAIPYLILPLIVVLEVLVLLLFIF
jgi:hypothetical protein